jgi:hypothetical protein
MIDKIKYRFRDIYKTETSMGCFDEKTVSWMYGYVSALNEHDVITGAVCTELHQYITDTYNSNNVEWGK